MCHSRGDVTDIRRLDDIFREGRFLALFQTYRYEHKSDQAGVFHAPESARYWSTGNHTAITSLSDLVDLKHTPCSHTLERTPPA